MCQRNRGSVPDRRNRFIIPETIDRLQLYKGPYFTQFGDFSNAGALNFVTKDEFPQNFAYASGGYFSTQRYVLGGSVPLDWAKDLLAADPGLCTPARRGPQTARRRRE